MASVAGSQEQAPAAHGHSFCKKTFHKPTYCHHCSDMLWGLIQQGFICEGELPISPNFSFYLELTPPPSSSSSLFRAPAAAILTPSPRPNRSLLSGDQHSLLCLYNRFGCRWITCSDNWLPKILGSNPLMSSFSTRQCRSPI